MKIFFTSVLFFLILTPSFSQVRQEIFYTFAHSVDRGMEGGENFLSLSYGAEFNKVNLTAGFQSGAELTDITLKGEYFPFRFENAKGNVKRLGTDLVYHVQYHDYYCEQDFLWGIDFEWKSLHGFFIRTATWLKYKYTDIYSVIKSTSKIEPDAYLAFGKVFDSGTTVSLSHGFHSMYRYNSVSESVFTFSVRQDFNAGISLKAETEICFTDQMAAVNHLESSQFRVAMGVRF
ncbi:hypothetical protein [Treponema sp.]|uniref:hypothetical protein n=1 Tax=Treponema sp. TaxID=166 RepID=UPI00257A0A02|nr:hypothetical protein [Treponema sp.]MBE6355427.1 hypothetical protein [Treponema sp.]